MAKYAVTSPYYTTTSTNGYLSVLNYRSIPFQNDDIQYVIEQAYEYRPDLLSYRLYQLPTLWWVFSVRNPTVIKDPIFDFTAGTAIFLPKLSTLKQSLGI